MNEEEIEDNGFNKKDVKILTDLATIKEQISQIRQTIEEIYSGYKAQWIKTDDNSRQIAILQAKATIFGGLAGIIMAVVVEFFAKGLGK